MKTITNIGIMLLFLLLAGNVAAQKATAAKSYKVINGKVVLTHAKPDSGKTSEKVYGTVKGVTYYIGAKGGVYTYKVSKNTGKTYKYYLTKEK